MTRDQAAEFLKRVRDGLGPIVHQATLPILEQDNDGELFVVGTGILFELKDQSFLITSGHLLERVTEQVKKKDKKKGAKPVTLFIPDANGAPTPLASDEVMFPEQWQIFDIGIVKPLKEDTDNFAKLGLKALGIGDYMSATHVSLAPGGGYVLHGYPRKLAETVSGALQPQPLYLGCTKFDGNTAGFQHFNKDVHLALKLGSPVRNTETGKFEPLPDISGMSGCSVWRSYSRDQINEGWEPSMARLVGVQFGFYEAPKVIVVASWNLVMEAVWKRWPELK